MQRLIDHPEHQFHIVCGDKDVIDDIKVWLPRPDKLTKTRTIRLGRQLHWQTGLWKIACSKKFDTLIIRGNVNCVSTWYVSVLARLYGKRVFFWGHGWRRRVSGIKKWIRQLMFKTPNAFLYYGKAGRDLGVEYGFDAAHTFIINNSQEMLKYEDRSLEERRGLKSQLFADPNRPTAICSTRLTSRKKLHQLLEAVAMLPNSSRPNVLIVGDGPERERLESLSLELGVDCHFQGACYDEEKMRDFFACSTVAVCPAAVGLSAIHSLNYGVPMLTNNHFENHGPEFEAIRPGETGDFFDTDDIDSMASAISKWTQSEFPTHEARSRCINLVQDFYSPEFQEKAIVEAVSRYE